MLKIYPYWSGECWMFDDAEKELKHEPFVLGASEMITACIEAFSLRRDGLVLEFSEFEIPDYMRKLVRTAEERGGNWYIDEDGDECWLCPALFKYFEKAPETLYVRIGEQDVSAIAQGR
jgi:hypothetical protein